MPDNRLLQLLFQRGLQQFGDENNQGKQVSHHADTLL
jgi:hypothetical protein